MKAAKVMCEKGIFEKFRQNELLANLLMSTESQMLAEASRDTDWGTGMSLYDERCLVQSTWYAQGLLGTILEEVRQKLVDSKGGNSDEVMDHEGSTDNDNAIDTSVT